MRRLTLRPVLALARYHVLSRLRPAWGVFGIMFLFAFLPILMFGGLFGGSSEVRFEKDMVMHFTVAAVHVTWILHILFLVGAADLLSIRRPPSSEGRPAAADLTETVPIGPAERYTGEMLGVLGAVLMVHVCTLPLLVVAFVQSPLRSSTFFWFEAVVLAVAVLAAAGSSWKGRAGGRWGRTRTARTAALFGILLAIVLSATTRWDAFRDALLAYFTEPSPRRWSLVAAEVMNPPLLALLLVLLYGGFITFFALSSIRSLERQ